MFFDHFQNTFPDRFFGTGSTVTSSTRRRLLGTAASTSGLLALALKQSRTVTVLHTLLLLHNSSQRAIFQNLRARKRTRENVLFFFVNLTQDLCLLQRLKLNLHRLRFGPLVLYITRTTTTKAQLRVSANRWSPPTQIFKVVAPKAHNHYSNL